jgi:hypothetical protein
VKQEGNGLSDEQLEMLLKASPDVAPSASLLRAVAEIPLRHPRAGVEAWWPFGLRRWFAVLAAALVTGVAVGVVLPDFESDDDAGWDALSTVAMGADLSQELAP